MIEYQLDVLSNSAGELKDTRKKQKEGEMIQRAFLTILGIMVGLLALLFVVLVLIKGAIQKFLGKFSPKKTAVVATMALVLLSVATANAGEVVKLEGNSLVYYQTTKEIPNVPSGITAEQAQQLVDGVVPSVKLSADKAGFYFGLPIAETKTDTIISFRGGWITEEVSNESLSVFSILVIAVLMLYVFIMAYTDSRGVILFMVIVLTLFVSVAVFSLDAAFTQVVGVLGTLSFISYFLGRYLRRRREKRQNAESHVLEVETVLEIET